MHFVLTRVHTPRHERNQPFSMTFYAFSCTEISKQMSRHDVITYPIGWEGGKTDSVAVDTVFVFAVVRSVISC